MLVDRAAGVDPLWHRGRPARILASGDLWCVGPAFPSLPLPPLLRLEAGPHQVGIGAVNMAPKMTMVWTEALKSQTSEGIKATVWTEAMSQNRFAGCWPGQSATGSQSRRRPALRAVRGGPIPQRQTTTERLFHATAPPPQTKGVSRRPQRARCLTTGTLLQREGARAAAGSGVGWTCRGQRLAAAAARYCGRGKMRQAEDGGGWPRETKRIGKAAEQWNVQRKAETRQPRDTLAALPPAGRSRTFFSPSPVHSF